MRASARDDRGAPSQFETARVIVQCSADATHARSLILEQATIYADGWARWIEDGHVYVGYVQTGRCCDAPTVSAM